MKITAVKTFPLNYTEVKVVGERSILYLFVKVETDSGIFGLGEIGISKMGGAVINAIEHLSERLIGEDPWSTEKHWQLMFRGNFFPAGIIYCSAISGIDIALWDIKAKSVNLPLYKLLGGPVRDKVVCYPHIGGRHDLDELVKCARQAVG